MSFEKEFGHMSCCAKLLQDFHFEMLRFNLALQGLAVARPQLILTLKKKSKNKTMKRFPAPGGNVLYKFFV